MPHASETLWDTVARRAFDFFWNESHPGTGLTKDRAKNAPDQKDDYTVASIAATGYALAAWAIGAERRWIGRDRAQARTVDTLRFLRDRLPHEHGFHYHFVDWRDGKRVWNCELSSIDTTLLVLGALAAGVYFGGEARRLADALAARMDWPWMQNRGPDDPEWIAPSMGWKPEEGFLKSRWSGYTEATYLFLLALGAPRGLPRALWDRWEFPETTLEGLRVFGGPSPIFWAQMTPGYFDLRRRRDRQGRDWWKNFENAHRANAAYCARNAERFQTYRDGVWGITACDQPPPVGYGAQSPRDGDNDGTAAPTAALAGVLFVPALAERALRTLHGRHRGRLWGRYGFANAFNVDKDWYDPDVLGIDLGMMLLAIENRRSGLIWRLTARHPILQKGITAAGFSPKA